MKVICPGMQPGTGTGGRNAQPFDVSRRRFGAAGNDPAAWADMAAAERWVDSEFQPSALSRDDQLAEMQWFVDAAKPFDSTLISMPAKGVAASTNHCILES